MAYLHFYDVVINDKTGVPIPGVIVRAYIRDEDNNTSTLADIYANDSGTPIGNVSGIPNAAVTDNGGNYGFFAAAGDYDIKFYVGDALLYVLQDITIGGPGVGDLTGPTGASFIGLKKDIPGSVLRNVAEVLEEIVQLSDFVLPTDASAAVSMQRCHDGLAAMGIRAAKVNIAAGTYVIDRNVMLNLVAIDWHGEAPSIGPNIDSGTVFDIQGSDFTPFTITRTLGPDESRGGGFHNIAVHQSQPDLATGWEPIDYPAIFDCVDLLGEFTLNNIYGMHCTRLVKSVLSGRLVVSGLRGQFFKNIVEMDNSLDIPRFFDWHIWTYWTSADVVMQYQQANFVPFIFGRVDTPFLDHIFIFACDAVMKIDQTLAGVTTKVIVGNLTCDFTRTVIRATSPILTSQIATLNHQGEAWPSTGTPLAGSRTIDCSGDNANIQIGNLQATTLSDASIVVSGNACKVSIFSALWDKINTSGGYGAVYANPTCDVTVSDYDIINSGSTSLSSPTGSLANTAVSQNMLPSDDSRVYASSGAAGISPKIYVEGAATNKDLELGAKGTGVVRSISGLQLAARTVASLPPVGIEGVSYYVTDASTLRPGDVVAGGGTFKAEVEYINGAYRVKLVNDTSFRSVERMAQEQVLREYGAVFNNVGNDGVAIQNYINSFGTRGGQVVLPALTTLISTPIVVDNATVAIKGVVTSYALSQGTGVSIAVPDAFDLRNADGFMFTNAHIRATGSALTSGSIFDFKASDTSSSNSGMLLFDNLRIEGGWNAFTFRKVFQAQLRGVRVANMAGEYCFGHNGLNDDSQANIFEYHGVTAGGVRYSNCDLWVFNGGGGSAKFTDCAGNFGRHGMVIKSETLGPVRTISAVAASPAEEYRLTTSVNHGFVTGDRVIIDGVTPDNNINGEWTVTKVSDTQFDLVDSEYTAASYTGGTAQKTQGRDPGFIYWQGGGFENLGGDAFRLERGGKLLVSNAYFSTDSTGNVVNQFSTYKGRIKFVNCDIRAAGGHGIILRAGNATFTACDINNNGRVYVDNLKVNIATIADNGSGLARFTTATPHGYSTGDRVRTSRTNGCDGSTRITVISPTVFDGDLIPYVSGAVGGQSWRFYRGVANVVDHGDGRIRVTVPGHPFKEGDWIHFSTASVGVPGVAGGDFKIAYVDADNFVLALSIAGTVPAFSGTYTGGGYVQYCCAQIVIASGSSGVDITGCFIGTSSSGVNRARYSIIIEPGCTNINIDSTISLDARSAVVNLSASDPTVRVTNRRVRSAMLELLGPVAPANDKLIRIDGAGGIQLIDWTTRSGTPFTPSVTSATPGDLSVSYTSATGTYRKRDRSVEIDVVLVFTPTYTTATGEFRIAGLPFPADGSTAYSCMAISSMSAFTWPNAATQIYLEAQGGQSYLTLVWQKSGSSNTNQQITGFASGTQVTLRFRGSYFTSV